MAGAQTCAVCGKPMDPNQWGNFHVKNKVTKEEKHAHAECVKRDVTSVHSAFSRPVIVESEHHVCPSHTQGRRPCMDHRLRARLLVLAADGVSHSRAPARRLRIRCVGHYAPPVEVSRSSRT